jgi:hypothetical protein
MKLFWLFRRWMVTTSRLRDLLFVPFEEKPLLMIRGMEQAKMESLWRMR